MTTALTAGAVLRSMESRQRMASLQAIDDLPFHERALVEEALKSVPGRRKVDLAKLIAEVRQQTYLRQAQPIDQEEQAALAWRYARDLDDTDTDDQSSLVRYLRRLTDAERKQIRDADIQADTLTDAIRQCDQVLGRNAAPRPAERPGREDSTRARPPYRTSSSTPSESSKRSKADDELPDDEWLTDDEPRPRRQIPRYRPHAQQSNAKPQAARPSFIGGQPLGPANDARPFGCPDGADYAQWSRPTMPSWLLPDDEDDDECP